MMTPFNKELLLTIRNLRVRFEPRNLPPELLLNNVCMPLFKGLVHVLVGGNGTGKTSLLKTIIGLLPENSAYLDRCIEMPNGDVISGVDLPKAIKVGYIPQHPHEALVPTFNVAENISFRTFFRGNSGMSDWLIRRRYGRGVQKKIEQIICSFGITKDILTDKLCKGVMHLSGGEQQIVNLAAMVFDDCDLLIMDEPTSKLDRINRKRFWDFIREIRDERRITMLVVTHDNMAHGISYIADQLFSIEGGTVLRLDPGHDIQSNSFVGK